MSIFRPAKPNRLSTIVDDLFRVSSPATLEPLSPIALIQSPNVIVHKFAAVQSAERLLDANLNRGKVIMIKSLIPGGLDDFNADATILTAPLAGTIISVMTFPPGGWVASVRTGFVFGAPGTVDAGNFTLEAITNPGGVIGHSQLLQAQAAQLSTNTFGPYRFLLAARSDIRIRIPAAGTLGVGYAVMLEVARDDARDIITLFPGTPAGLATALGFPIEVSPSYEDFGPGVYKGEWWGMTNSLQVSLTVIEYSQ